MKARLWRFVHNVFAHPLMEVLPPHWGAIIHDATAQKAFGIEHPIKDGPSQTGG